MAVATPQEKRIEGQNARWDKFRLLIREEFPDAFADLQRVNSPESWAAYLDKYPQYNFDPEVYAGPIKTPPASHHADTTPISAPAPLPGTEAATGIAFLPIALLFAPKAQTYEEDGKYQKMVRQITKEQQKKWKEEQKKTKGEKVKEGDKRWVDFMHGSLGQGKDDTPSIHDRARVRFRSKYPDRAKKYDQKEAEIKKSDKKDRSVVETRAHVSHEYTDRLILHEKEWEEKRKALEKDKALRKSLSSKQWREKKEAFEKEKEEARNDLYKKVQEKHWDYYTAAHPEKVKAYAQQIEEQKKKEKNEKKKKEYDQIDIAQAQKRKEERDARNISTQQASERLDAIANPQPQTQPITLVNAQQQVISTTQAPQIPQPVVPGQLPPAPPAQPSFQPPILSTPTQVLTPANPIILPSSQVNSSTLVSPSGRPISSVQQPAPPVAHPQGLVDVHQQPLPNTQSTHPAVTNQPVQQQPKEKKKGRLKRFTDRIDHIKDRFDVKRILKDKIKAKINSMLSDRAKNLLGKFGRFQKFLNPGQMARNYAQQAGRFVAKQAANAARSGARLAAQGMRVVAQMAMQVAKQAAVMAAQALASAAASAGSALVAAASPFIGIGALIVIGVILAILLIIIIVVVIGCVLGWFPCGEPPPGEETTTTQSPIPGLTLELEGPTTIQNSDNISYSISVSYTGDLDVTITDPLLTTNSSFVSATGVYTPTTPTTQVMWRLNDNPTTPISTAESTKKYTFSIVLKPNTPDSIVKNKVIARATSAGFAGGAGCPSQAEIAENRKDRNTCHFFNPSIDIFDTTLSQQSLDNYVAKYSPIFIRAGKGDINEFRNRANYIVSQSQKAGLNPAIFLGYWKTESAFSTVGNRDMGCPLSVAGFNQQVDCAVGLRPGGYRGAQCAISKDANSPSCRELKGIRDSHPTIYGKYPLTYPIATFDDFAEGYGPIAPNLEGSGVNNNCIHTYNVLIEVAEELNACKITSTNTGSAEHPQAPPASQNAQQLRRDIIDKFGISFDGFDTQHLQWAWEKLWNVSNTKFPALIKGTNIKSIPGIFSYQRSCTSAGGSPYVELVPAGNKAGFQFVLIHELGHVIQRCRPTQANIDNQIAAFNSEGGVSYYASAATLCHKDANNLWEDYADMIAYYLNPNFGVEEGSCIAVAGNPNPFISNTKPLHYNGVTSVLGKY